MPPSATIRLVIPCYNPAAGWSDLLVRRAQALRTELGLPDLPITLVDDGSTRGITAADRETLVAGLGPVEWLSHPVNRGKGAALRTGVLACQGPCLITDVDLPYTTESMATAYRSLLSGADVVLGHRRMDYYARVPLARRVISRSFRWVLRNVMRFPISDTQCGLKGFGDQGRTLFLRTTIDRFLFDMEFVMLVSRRTDLRTEVVEARLNEGVRFSRMNYRILLRESVNFVKVAARGLLRS